MQYNLYVRYRDASVERGWSQILVEEIRDYRTAESLIKHPPAELFKHLKRDRILALTSSADDIAYSNTERPVGYAKARNQQRHSTWWITNESSDSKANDFGVEKAFASLPCAAKISALKDYGYASHRFPYYWNTYQFHLDLTDNLSQRVKTEISCDIYELAIQSAPATDYNRYAMHRHALESVRAYLRGELTRLDAQIAVTQPIQHLTKFDHKTNAIRTLAHAAIKLLPEEEYRLERIFYDCVHATTHGMVNQDQSLACDSMLSMKINNIFRDAIRMRISALDILEPHVMEFANV